MGEKPIREMKTFIWVQIGYYLSVSQAGIPEIKYSNILWVFAHETLWLTRKA